MTFTLPQPPESPNIRAIAAYINLNSGGGGSSTDWSSITSKPTTLSGFGITDAYTKAASDARYAVPATSLAGYGITDAYTKTASDARYLQLSGGTMTGDLTGTRVTLHDNLLYESYTNGNANLAMNYLGYAGGTTQYRDFSVYDGKSVNLLYITGSTKAAVFAGNVTAPDFTLA